MIVGIWLLITTLIAPTPSTRESILRIPLAEVRKPAERASTAPVFVLMPKVKLRKRLDLARDAERMAGRAPGLVVDGWVAIH